MRRALELLRRALPDNTDVHLYGGTILIAGGAGLYSLPAGLIVGGILLLVIVAWRPE